MNQQILHDLSYGQSSADAIALRVGIPEAAVHQILLRERSAGTVEARPICNGAITVWSLTKPAKR